MRSSIFLALPVAATLAACASPSSSPASSPSPSPPALAVAAPAVPVVAPPSRPPAGETPEQRAARLHAQAIIVDGHNDVPSLVLENSYDLDNPRHEQSHTDLARMKAGGITGEFFSIYVDASLWEKPTPLGGGAARRALDLIDVTYQQIERHPAELMLATSAAEIRRAKREGKVAVLMGIEGGHAIENSLFALRSFYRLGCRYMTLTHTNTNDWADSAGSFEPAVVRHHGLSPFGEEVVREMQRIGMLVDISHVSDETFRAVMKVAKAPVIASHSSSRALGHHRRNLDDDMLRELAKNGGVAMVNFWASLLDDAYGEQMGRFLKKNGAHLKELREKYKGDPKVLLAEVQKLKAQEAPLKPPPLSRLVDHIDHIVKVAGIDHVGLGSDFDGVDTLPEGLSGIDGLPKITLELVRRGYQDEDILKILGGNFLRVFEQAEAYAASSRTTLSGAGSTRMLTAAELPPPSPAKAASTGPSAPHTTPAAPRSKGK